MRFYKLHRTHDAGESAGYEFFTNKADAEAALRGWFAEHVGVDADNGGVGGDIEAIEVEPTKAGILRALNRYADHNDNG